MVPDTQSGREDYVTVDVTLDVRLSVGGISCSRSARHTLHRDVRVFLSHHGYTLTILGLPWELRHFLILVSPTALVMGTAYRPTVSVSFQCWPWSIFGSPVQESAR